MTAPRNDLTPEFVREVLDYDPATGEFRWRWRDDVRAQWNGRYARTVSGTINNVGYRMIVIDKRLYLAHRLAWLHVSGAWPSDQIDHINGVRDDNRIEDLRESTRVENGRNSRRKSNNRCGFKGVSKYGRKWRATISVGGKQQFIGYFATADAAHAAYCEASARLHGEFARFQ
jgi:hypothetical protein